MTEVEKAIEASRQRERHGRGACPCVSDEVCHCETRYSIALETFEPRFREMVAQLRAIADRIHRGLEEGVATVPDSLAHKQLTRALKNCEGIALGRIGI